MTAHELRRRFGLWRPLDRLPSIKWKLSLLVAGAVSIAVVVSVVGYRLGWAVWVRPIVSVGIGLAVMRVFSFGITSPLREMADAAQRMASGDYSTRVTATSKDEVGQLADAFNEMAADLAALDRQRRDLVANASHELRTPIAALSAMIENLADGVATADAAYVETMHQQVQRLAHLVDQLLSLSRLESGETELHREPTDLVELATSVVDEARWRHPDVEMVVRSAVAARAEVDPVLVHQVLSNLVENAVRHGSPPVEVEILRHPDHVRLIVRDHGPGIPADASERIFERFERLDRSRRGQGAGLGLSIVAGIVERHGGSIHVEDVAPHGAAFVVTLPTTPLP